MSEPLVVGVRPWLPWPLSRSRWWTEPVPAQRLAALRIGLAFVLLFDVLTSYLPGLYDFFGADSLGSPDAFPDLGQGSDWRWSLLRGITDHRVLATALAIWAAATFGLLVGLMTRFCAVVVWLLALSFAHVNPLIENAGDEVRGIVLFYLMVCPCGATWSLDARRREQSGEVRVWPWPLRLLFVQLVLIYFCNGLYKLEGDLWRSGDSVYYVLHDLTLTRWSYQMVPVPYWLTKVMTWAVLVWEVGFPLLVALRWTRIPALVFGVLMHLGIGLFLEVGFLTPYMLCLYLPLMPWERLRA